MALIKLNNNSISTGFGKVGQVVIQHFDTVTTVASQAFADTGLTANITPSATSSKVLITFTISASNQSGTIYPAYKIFRDSTEIGTSTTSGGTNTSVFAGGSINSQYHPQNISMTFMDSPSTTNQVTYKLQLSPQRSSSKTVKINAVFTGGDNNQLNTTSNTTLMELLA